MSFLLVSILFSCSPYFWTINTDARYISELAVIFGVHVSAAVSGTSLDKTGRDLNQHNVFLFYPISLVMRSLPSGFPTMVCTFKSARLPRLTEVFKFWLKKIEVSYLILKRRTTIRYWDFADMEVDLLLCCPREYKAGYLLTVPK